jgi:hypothetical protein
VNLVNEQHVVRFQIGQQRRQVARALQHRAGGLAQVDTHLARDDVRQRGLAQSRRAEQQHVVERLAAVARGMNEDFELFARLRLTDVFGQRARPQRALDLLLNGAGGGGGDKTVGFDHAYILYQDCGGGSFITAILTASAATIRSVRNCSPISRWPSYSIFGQVAHLVCLG